MKASLLKMAPVSATANKINVTIVRARGPGDHRGNRVWPKVIVESAPQYKFIALDEAIPIEKTMSTSGVIPLVNTERPCTKPPSGTARPITAPKIMGRSDPKVQ